MEGLIYSILSTWREQTELRQGLPRRATVAAPQLACRTPLLFSHHLPFFHSVLFFAKESGEIYLDTDAQCPGSLCPCSTRPNFAGTLCLRLSNPLKANGQHPLECSTDNGGIGFCRVPSQHCSASFSVGISFPPPVFCAVRSVRGKGQADCVRHWRRHSQAGPVSLVCANIDASVGSLTAPEKTDHYPTSVPYFIKRCTL